MPWLALGCSSGGAPIEPPVIDAPYVLIGFAGGGRSLVPEDLKIVSSSNIPVLRITGTGNATVDYLYAGLRPEDLPSGMSPTDLVFATSADLNTRAIPPLVRPHVLAAPAPPGATGTLVEINADGISDDERAYRQKRFEALTKDLRLKDPCRAPPFSVSLPRISAAAVPSARVMSDGSVVLGLAMSGTIALGRFTDDPENLELMGVDAPASSPVVAEEPIRVVNLGEGEVPGPDGRPRPAALAIWRSAAVGQVLRYDAAAKKYLDDSPQNVDPSPSYIELMRTLSLDGADRFVIAGGTQGTGQMGSGARLAGMWSRSSTGGAWRVEASIPTAHDFLTVLTPPGLGTLAIDYTGTVHQGSFARGWQPTVTPAVNQNCGAVPCRPFAAAIPGPPSSGALAILGGQKGEIWTIRGTSASSLRAEQLGPAMRSFFSDEVSGDFALNVQDMIATPDDAIWIATTRSFMVRVSPDLSTAERVCVPDLGGQPPTAIAARSDGALIVAASPPYIGVGSWKPTP